MDLLTILSNNRYRTDQSSRLRTLMCQNLMDGTLKFHYNTLDYEVEVPAHPHTDWVLTLSRDEVKLNTFRSTEVSAFIYGTVTFVESVMRDHPAAADENFERFAAAYKVSELELAELDAEPSEDLSCNMRVDARNFYHVAKELIAEDEGRNGVDGKGRYGEYDRYELAGYDFALTRNGHGAGFWDGDWDNGDELTELCKPFDCTGSELYIGDDGRIHR